MKITFWGATRTVTGSMHEVQVNGRSYLLECGLFQGRRQHSRERNTQFPFSPSRIRAVILTHAHIDHSGNLPNLVKQGFQGKVFATPATADLCDPMLKDSAHLQEKDAEYLNKRHWRRGRLLGTEEVAAVEPLYTQEDAAAAVKHFEPVPLYTPVALDPELSFEFYEAGHILGSGAVLLHYHSGGRKVRVGFSGDLGRPNQAIVRDPDRLPPVDYLILESTYGDRLHKDLQSVASKLADVVNRTCARGGKIIVPAFAVGRTQQLIVLLHQLFDEQRIPRIPIFVDSPLAVEATKVFRRHPECFDDETREYLLNNEDPFGFASLKFVTEASESKALNELRGPFMVISASGMCEAGRILHHLKNNIEDPRNTILITGFMAENTLGRKIVDKQPEVPIFGEPMRLRAEVAKLNELSAHADQQELLQWIEPLARSLKKVFLIHGEKAQAEALANALRRQFGLESEIPERGHTVDLG